VTRGFSGGDDPYALLATPGKNYHQESSEGIHTKRDKSFFIGKIICRRQCKCITEHSNRISKADTMLLEIGNCFVWVPLIVHRQPPLLGRYTFIRIICTDVHKVKRGLLLALRGE